MTDGFTLVALLSTYREGPLAQGAIRSIASHVDHVIVWEGPAGDARCDGAPATELEPGYPTNLRWNTGEWATDAAKRSDMIEYLHGQFQGPVWALWLDGDEILENGHHLRDCVRSIVWRDQDRGASILDPEKPPVGGAPIYFVEIDGSVGHDDGRLIRADLIRRYLVSNLILETTTGAKLRLGRKPMDAAEWIEPRLALHGQGLFLLPPLPGEPFVVHRSHLRHPDRLALPRAHKQEHDELVRLGLPT